MDFFNENVRKFISENIDLDINFKYERFKVGRSNITFKIYDDFNQYVLRRPPFGSKLESAHNMQREFRVISELYKYQIKVPKALLIYVDKKISEDDFYIMEYVDGDTISDNIVANEYSINDKKKITESLIKNLAYLHNFNVLSTDLKDLGKHNNYVERQLKRWGKQFEAQKIRDLESMDNATNMLLDTIPEQQRVSLVHGDYRLDNVRIKDNNVAAILDWELCTLGDPLADLGTIIASWSNKDELDTPFIYSPSLSEGFLSRKEILSIYENECSLSLKDIEFYVRLSFWKHAMIMEGVYVRYSLGYYGDTDKNEIDAFGQSTINFLKKANNNNLLEEIL